MEQIIRIPLERLRESPSNPRKRFPEAQLQELADSIRAVDVLSAILVRPLDQADIEQTHEIVFGHRRFRASQLAGKVDIRAEVREMSEADAALAQMHENIQRQDMTALEEAFGIVRLQEDFGFSAEEIALKLKKSRAWVYRTRRLATAAPEVRDAVENHGLQAETACELACIGSHTLQVKWLQQLRGYAHGITDPWISTREAKAVLGRVTRLRLQDAPFTTMQKVAPDDEAPACHECPSQAGNNPDMEKLPADLCTDHLCYAAKTSKHWALVVARLQDAGHRVVLGDEAKEMLPNKMFGIKGYVDLSEETEIQRADDTGLCTTFGDLVAEASDAGPRLLYVWGHSAMRLFGFLTNEDADALVQRAMGVVVSAGAGVAVAEDAAARADSDGTASDRVVWPFPRPAEGAGATVPDAAAKPAAAASRDDQAHAQAAAPAPATPPAAGSHQGQVQPWEKRPTAQDAYSRARDQATASWTLAERVAMGKGSDWDAVIKAVVKTLMQRQRTTHEMRVLGHEMVDVLAMPAALQDAMGGNAADDERTHAWIDEASPDQLGAFLAGWGVAGFLEHNIHHANTDARAGIARRIAVVESYGVDVLAAAGLQPEEEHEAEEEADVAATAPAPAATLSAHAEAALTTIARKPLPRQEFNPGVAKALEDAGLVEVVSMPSPYKRGKGTFIQHLRATAAGLAHLESPPDAKDGTQANNPATAEACNGSAA